MIVKIRRLYKRLKSLFFTYIAKKTIVRSPKFKANGFTKLSKKTSLGTDCHFNGLIINGGGVVKIGDNFHSGENVRFITEDHNYNGSRLPYDNTNIVKDILIGENVWLGRDVTILGGVDIGEGVIIQAGSVVTSDIPPLSIAGGHPARVFSKRDSAHYFKLKNI
jgi:acetyltransferase-like isoleucine patch superfamily enzyme